MQKEVKQVKIISSSTKSFVFASIIHHSYTLTFSARNAIVIPINNNNNNINNNNIKFLCILITNHAY
jgi:hypothetical protein